MRSVKGWMWAWSLGAVLCVGSPAWAQTVTWVTAPPPVAPAGGQFTVEWEVAGFVNPLTQNAVAWGQTTLEGQTPDQPGGNAVYSAVVDVVATPGPLFYAAFADSGTEFAFAPPVEVLVSQELADVNARLAALEAALAAVQANSVLALDGLLVGTVHNGQPTARFEGVNVQVRNGAGQSSVNGLGNLIIGYDEPNTLGQTVCSDPLYDNQVDCEANGAVWSRDHKSGSHNLVAGRGNSYAAHSGVVFGQGNTITAPDAVVLAGLGNVASGTQASVGAGEGNVASGFASVVAGGVFNKASADHTSVTGGRENWAMGLGATVSAGRHNLAEGDYSAVTGGGGVSAPFGNVAQGLYSSATGGSGNFAVGESSAVTGGTDNDATGKLASVSGGGSNQASGFAASIAGGQANVASGDTSSVTGGQSNTAIGSRAAAGGGLNRTATGDHDWVAGGLFQDN